MAGRVVFDEHAVRIDDAPLGVAAERHSGRRQEPVVLIVGEVVSRAIEELSPGNMTRRSKRAAVQSERRLDLVSASALVVAVLDHAAQRVCPRSLSAGCIVSAHPGVAVRIGQRGQTPQTVELIGAPPILLTARKAP